MPKSTVVGIITKRENDKVYILLARRNTEPYKDYWSIPGGHVEEKETTKEAVVREIKEEIGLNYKPRFLMTFDEKIPSKNINAIVSIYTGTVTGEQSILKKEISEVNWFDISEVVSMDLAFLHNQVLIKYLNGLASESREEMLLEYSCLREEILKRMDIRNHLLTFTLIVSGAILTYGTTENASFIVLLIYPILALFLALGWMHSDLRAGELGRYIKDNIEGKLKNIGWEHYLGEIKSQQKRTLLKKATEISASGVFLITEILSIFLALSKMSDPSSMTISSNKTVIPLILILLVLDLAAIVLTIILLRQRRKKYI
jgi:8-oxo-dGTP diphosphatase